MNEVISMSESHMRVRAEIDLDAVIFNMEAMKAKIDPETKITAVIKADAYGHGAVQIAHLLENDPCLWGFAVAAAEEGMELRNNGIRKPILLLSYAFSESWADMIDYDIRFAVFDYEAAAGISGLAVSLGKKARIHIALDTGMSRIGFRDTDESAEIVKKIAALPGIEIEGLFTHFARADEPSIAPAERQLARYMAFSEKLETAGVDVPVHHVSNSAGIFRMRNANLSMVRAGITLYGFLPSDDVREEVQPLKPVMRLVSHISFVKELIPGAEISYGGTFKVEKPMRVATIPVGYADGYPRMLSNKGCVLIRGRRAPIVGRVCMDQFMVDVTEIPEAVRGDEAVLMGAQGEETITAEEIGALSGRFNYELVSDITRRVPRHFLRGGRTVSVRTLV